MKYARTCRRTSGPAGSAGKIEEMKKGIEHVNEDERKKRVPRTSRFHISRGSNIFIISDR